MMIRFSLRGWDEMVHVSRTGNPVSRLVRSGSRIVFPAGAGDGAGGAMRGRGGRGGGASGAAAWRGAQIFGPKADAFASFSVYLQISIL